MNHIVFGSITLIIIIQYIDTRQFTVTKCIEKNPAFDKAYANRCQIYLKQKKYNEALEDIDKAIKINFKNPDYYFDKSFVKKALKMLSMGQRTIQ